MRKHILVMLLLLNSTLVLAYDENPEEEEVHDYNKSNGVHVEGYHRTKANDDPYDNYSTKGNVNPYTNEKGAVEPDSRLEYPKPHHEPNAFESHHHRDQEVKKYFR